MVDLSGRFCVTCACAFSEVLARLRTLRAIRVDWVTGISMELLFAAVVGACAVVLADRPRVSRGLSLCFGRLLTNLGLVVASFSSSTCSVVLNYMLHGRIANKAPSCDTQQIPLFTHIITRHDDTPLYIQKQPIEGNVPLKDSIISSSTCN